MRFRLAIMCVVGLTVTWNAGPANAANIDDFVDFSGAIPGQLYVPPEAANLTSPRPFVLYLHGGLVGGTNNRSHINSDFDRLLDAAKERGAYLYAPQSPYRWNTGYWNSSEEIMTMIDQAIEQENIDPNRLYVTGQSFGGGGTWDMLNNVDDRFAAALPISTDVIRPGLDAANFLDTPIWAFHARDDNIASVGRVRRIVNDILAEVDQPKLEFPSRSDNTVFEYQSDVVPLKYTELAHGTGNWNHYIWHSVWSTEEVMDWMFSQKLGQTPLVTGDFDGNGILDITDIDQLASEIIAQTHTPSFDVTNDGVIDQADLTTWVKDLKQTWFGDANLDGEFNSGDLVAVFKAGQYEDSIPNNSTWATGDWNGDREFDSGDLVSAFKDAGFEAGSRTAAAAVPEPSFLLLPILAFAVLLRVQIGRSKHIPEA